VTPQVVRIKAAGGGRLAELAKLQTATCAMIITVIYAMTTTLPLVRRVAEFRLRSVENASAKTTGEGRGGRTAENTPTFRVVLWDVHTACSSSFS
jgi:hypothetical protein